MFIQWITGFGFYIGSWTFGLFMTDDWTLGFSDRTIGQFGFYNGSGSWFFTE